MSKNKTRRAGSVTPLGDGRFWARLTVNGKRQSLGVHATEDLAQAMIDASIRQAHAAANGDATSSGLTFGAYAADVLDRRERAKFRNVHKDRSNLRAHILTHAISERLVVDIRAADIWRLYREMSEKLVSGHRAGRGRRLSYRTVTRIMSLVSAVMTEATRDELRPDNPCVGVKPPRKRADDPYAVLWDYLRSEEQTALANCPEVPEWGRLMMRVAWGTGLRQGEQWNLDLRDVHAGLDEPHPRVFVRWGSKGKSPKSGKTRTVDLFGDGLAAMREWLAFLPTYSPSNPLRLAFPLQGGTRRSNRAPADVRRDAGGTHTVYWLPEWLRAAGITRKLRWHDLRHTFASSLVSGVWGHKWALDEVRDQMGHSSVTVTELYAHLGREAVSASVARTRGVTGGVTVPALNSMNRP